MHAPATRKTAAEPGTDSIGVRFLQLVEEADVYFALENGHKQLSLTTGLFVNDLVKHCGVSQEKLPLAFTLLLTMLLGNAAEEVAPALVLSGTTFDRAGEKASAVALDWNRRRFDVTSTEEDAVLAAHLVIDDSNKGVDLTVLPYTALCKDGLVRSRALLTLQALTKQSSASARVTESIVAEVGEAGFSKITGGTSDACAAQANALRDILVRADAAAVTQPPADLLFVSSRNPGLVLDWRVPIRQMRQFYCKMHNLERLKEPLLTAILQHSGLEHNAETEQFMYMVNYYSKKLRTYLDAINISAAGGTVEALDLLAKEITRLVGKASAERWLTSERSSYELVQQLMVPASDDLQDCVKALFAGGAASAEWADLKRFAVCINSDALSHVILVYVWLSYVTTREPRDMCALIAAFLCSPAHRASLVIAAELYPTTVGWAKFLDGRAVDQKGLSFSVRALEVVDFDRQIVQFAHDISTDWHGVLPAAHDFILRESQRAVAIGASKTSQELVDVFEGLMKVGTAPMKSIATKYFIEETMLPGVSVLLLASPATVRTYARVILQYLAIDKFTPAGMPAVAALPQDERQTEVYAGLNAEALENCLRSALKSPTDRSVIYTAYGLKLPVVVQELMNLCFVAPTTADIGASSEEQLKEHHAHLQLQCPALWEMLCRCFEFVCITGTLAEQIFAITKHVIAANATPETNMNSVHHFQNIRKTALENSKTYQDAAATRAKESAEGSLRKSKVRPLRAEASRTEYAMNLLRIGRNMRASVSKVPTVRSLHDGLGKKKKHKKKVYKGTLEVMERNRKKTPGKKKKRMARLVYDIEKAKRAGESKLTLTVTEEEQTYKLTRATLIERLTGAEAHLTAKYLNKCKKDVLVTLAMQYGKG